MALNLTTVTLEADWGGHLAGSEVKVDDLRAKALKAARKAIQGMERSTLKTSVKKASKKSLPKKNLDARIDE